MNKETQDALDRAFATVRKDLAQQGFTWDQAWYWVKIESPGGGSSSLYFTVPPAGTIDSSRDGSSAREILVELRNAIPDAAGRPWNQILLTLHADGRQEFAVEYPGPVHDPNRNYTEQELIANIATCLRLDLTFEKWTEGWFEAGPELVAFISCHDGPSGQVENYIQDCNGLYQWLERLWQVRVESGAGGWSRMKFQIFHDNDRVETEFKPAERKAVEPPPLPRRVPSLDELFRRIIAAERADLDNLVRHMEDAGHACRGWRRVRLEGLREDDNVVYVERFVEFGDGETLDDVSDWEVEELFNDVFDRVDAGDDPTELDIPGLRVKPGPSPRFILVLDNDAPRPRRRRPE